MPTDFDNLFNEDIHVVNKDGEENGCLQDCEVSFTDVDTAYEFDKKYPIPKGFIGNISLDINQPLNPEVFGVDVAKFPDTVDIRYIRFISARRHRKKRINKKWLKRYGANYIPKHCMGKGWELKTYTDGSFEFVNNKLEANEEKVNEN